MPLYALAGSRIRALPHPPPYKPTLRSRPTKICPANRSNPMVIQEIWLSQISSEQILKMFMLIFLYPMRILTKKELLKHPLCSIPKMSCIPLPDEDADKERAFEAPSLLDPEVVLTYLHFPDEDPDVGRRYHQFLLAMSLVSAFFDGEENLECEDVFSEDEVPIAEGVEFSDDDSLVHEPLLGQRDEIWNDILEWPDLELNSISCGVQSPDGAFSFSVAPQDRIHWDKLIYLQDKQPWDYIDLENAYDEFKDLEVAAVENSEALHHAYLPVASLISYSQDLHHTDLPAPSSISHHLELQESGHPCREYDGSILFVDGDEDCPESSSSGYLVRDGIDDALNQECEALGIDDCLGHHEGSLRDAVLTELSLESTHPELQSNLPAAEDLNLLESFI